MNKLKPYKSFKWIVKDKAYLNGKLAVRDTRLPVYLVLQCLGEGMTLGEIEETYTKIPEEALKEVMLVAAEAVEDSNVAA